MCCFSRRSKTLASITRTEQELWDHTGSYSPSVSRHRPGKYLDTTVSRPHLSDRKQKTCNASEAGEVDNSLGALGGRTGNIIFMR